jgi:hypothetical protein
MDTTRFPRVCLSVIRLSLLLAISLLTFAAVLTPDAFARLPTA